MKILDVFNLNYDCFIIQIEGLEDIFTDKTFVFNIIERRKN